MLSISNLNFFFLCFFLAFVLICRMTYTQDLTQCLLLLKEKTGSIMNIKQNALCLIIFHWSNVSTRCVFCDTLPMRKEEGGQKCFSKRTSIESVIYCFMKSFIEPYLVIFGKIMNEKVGFRHYKFLVPVDY